MRIGREKGGWFLLAFQLFFRVIICQQVFSTEPSSILVPPGDNATLACIVKNMGGECRWQKNGKPIGLFPGKYSLPVTSKGGDCSLTIARVDLRIDDGEWQCQVTSSSISSQDALVSSPALLTVQVPPSSISIESPTGSVKAGGLLTVTGSRTESVTCITRHSNPAPTISWHLGDVHINSTYQNNTNEEESHKWKSVATLEYMFLKSDLGKRLQCLVNHPAYPSGENKTIAKLDVLYKPSVRIARVSSPVLEEGSGSVTLTCISESNPPARVMWSKLGENTSPEFKDMLQFNPVMRKHAGTYICQAENSVGRSEEEQTDVDILFAPIILRTEPLSEKSVMVHNKTVLTCTAEGNPEPKYEWLQQLPSGQVRKRSYSTNLVIEDVSYKDQGEYMCMASNLIGGERRQVQSEVVRLEVAGVPQVVNEGGKVTGVTGQDVQLEGQFCSDPMPVRNTWEWGGVVLPAGSEIDGRYKAELIAHPTMEDCYISRLVVRGVNIGDARTYTLSVENIHGRDSIPVALRTEDPVSMASVVAVVLLLLIIILLLVISLLIAYKKQKACFKGHVKEKEASLQENIYTNEAYSLSMKEGNSVNKSPFLSSNQNLSTLDLISQHSNSFPQTSLHQPHSLFNTPYYPSTSHNLNQSLTSLPHLSSSFQSPPQSTHQFSTLQIQPIGLPMSNRDSQHQSSRVSRSNFQIYSQLQVPSLSNNGSMKKKKKKKESEQLPQPPSPDLSPPPPSQSPASVSYASNPSPASHIEQEYYDGDVRVWEVQYVPQVMSINKKTVKV